MSKHQIYQVQFVKVKVMDNYQIVFIMESSLEFYDFKYFENATFVENAQKMSVVNLMGGAKGA